MGLSDVRILYMTKRICESYAWFEADGQAKDKRSNADVKFLANIRSDVKFLASIRSDVKFLANIRSDGKADSVL